MDFDFSEEQLQLREACAKWVSKACGFERRRQTVAAGGHDPGAYRALADLGLTGLCIAGEHGGMDMGPVEAMIVMEEMGRGLVLAPLGNTFAVSKVLTQFATMEQQARWLPKVASGDCLAVVAHQERAARYRLDRCETEATEQAGQWRLNGAKHLVPAADHADAFLLPATTPTGLRLFWVERQAAGLHTSGYPTQDGARAGDLHLADALATLVTTNGLNALALAADTALAALCAEAVGVMETTLALTVDYMNTRKQFGVPIASFQALRHRVADMKMQLELARSMSYYASLKLNAPAAERRLAVARAKVQLGQSMRFVGQQAVQLHGGIGVTDEYIISHCFKKLTQLEMSWGDTLHHLGALSAGMQDTAGVFA